MTLDGSQTRPAPDEWSDRHRPVKEDMAFQRASWRAERVAWGAMAVVAIAALAGAFGGGSLIGLEAERRAGDLVVRMPWVARIDAPTRLVVEVSGRSPGATVDLRLTGGFYDGVVIDDVQPAPEASAGGRDGLVHRHRIGGDGTLRVIFDTKPRIAGWLAFEVAAGDGPGVAGRQLVLP